MKHASDNSPRKGETVSDESPRNSDFEDLLTDEVIECRRLLRETVRGDADLEDIEVRVKEARARLELVERVVERDEGAR